MTLDTVDNDWWTAEAGCVDRARVRAGLGLNPNDEVILFCAKLQPWKRPLDVLRAFASASIPRSILVFAGDGTLRASIESEAAALGLRDRVRMLGFVNQSQLPAVYRACDVMVIASDYEPFGLVVNEAMLCGCVVVASDKVGAVRDLIFPGGTGFVYPCGDSQALAATLRSAFAERSILAQIRQAAHNRIRQWSPRGSAAALREAVVRAVGGCSSPQLLRSGGDAAEPILDTVPPVHVEKQV
jgi:glycosyltransferase involved in cell wall biosynthesis